MLYQSREEEKVAQESYSQQNIPIPTLLLYNVIMLLYEEETLMKTHKRELCFISRHTCWPDATFIMYVSSIKTLSHLLLRIFLEHIPKSRGNKHLPYQTVFLATYTPWKMWKEICTQFQPDSIPPMNSLEHREGNKNQENSQSRFVWTEKWNHPYPPEY